MSARPAPDRYVAAMRACLVGDDGAEGSLARIIRDGGTDELLERAAEHRVLSALEPHIRHIPGVDAVVLDRLARQAAGHAAHQLRILEGLRWFGALMGAEDIPWLTFKGPVVAQLLYEPVVLRTFQDLDLLVPRADFSRAIVALEREGGALLDRNWRLISREGRAQLHVALPLETEADVHWHVLNRHTIRSSFTLDMRGAFERARTVDVEGIPAPTFDPVDTIVHLALHASLGGADRLSWFDDIRREQDRRRVCGLTPIYALLSVASPGRGKLTAYGQCPAEEGSIVSIACSPWSCWSLLTSRNSGSARSASTNFGVHRFSSFTSGSSRLYWYCVRLTRSSTVRSCTGCRNSVMPSTLAISGCSRRLTALAPAPRWASGLRLMRILPLFSVTLVPSMPMNEERPATAGSRRITRASACWRSAMVVNETACGASEMPWMTPVS